MGFVARATHVAIALFGLMGGFEASAHACLLSADCSGATPICDLLSLKCRACGADLECGAILNGKVCATSGPKAGQCVGCGHNADCNGSTPVCDPLTLTCEGCATSADCGGTKPACDMATHTCKACTGDFLNVGGLSTMCPSVLEPACVTSGPNAGSCTECSATNALACVGHLQAPACVIASTIRPSRSVQNGEVRRAPKPGRRRPFPFALSGVSIAEGRGAPCALDDTSVDVAQARTGQIAPHELWDLPLERGLSLVGRW